MAVVPVERLSLQELLRPIIRADRHLTILRECLCQMLDASEDLDGHGAAVSLQNSIQHLERTIHLVKITRLLHLVTLQRHLQVQYRHHGLIPPIDWEFED